jgi:hypothetical protein
MREQCERLLELGELRNVDIQVMPTRPGCACWDQRPHGAAGTPDREHYAYEEGQAVSVLHSDSEDRSAISRSALA